MCPITVEIMTDPVIADDGHTYEKSAITAWLATRSNRSPMTNAALSSNRLVQNHTSEYTWPAQQRQLQQRAYVGSVHLMFVGSMHHLTRCLCCTVRPHFLEYVIPITPSSVHDLGMEGEDRL